MDGIIVLALIAVVAVWLFGRTTRAMRIAPRPKTYMTLTVVVVIGVLALYASSH